MAVVSQLALVVAELPAIKFIEPEQMVYDIVERKVYSAGQARGGVVQPPEGTNYLHINKQEMKMLKTKLHYEDFHLRFYTFFTIISFIVFLLGFTTEALVAA